MSRALAGADENQRRDLGSVAPVRGRQAEADSGTEGAASPIETRLLQEAPPHRWELLAARLPEDQALWFWVRAKLKFGPCAKRRDDRLLRLLFGAEFDESRARAQAWLRRG